MEAALRLIWVRFLDGVMGKTDFLHFDKFGKVARVSVERCRSDDKMGAKIHRIRRKLRKAS